ncbi:hypothetical protein [Litorihabitans aurantiacus]|uniref:Uncharacterized protein n=1 Tax=Litorihabitans aurantiacus TaxID=1930061 RepID=A0AA37UT59_9MICO|nr:hypothetical protein [Litorihabitans aurantiacus]GMA30755.1 hypothetical protein GCM10025875_07470 [Litorihabitans aurantiacus]
MPAPIWDTPSPMPVIPLPIAEIAAPACAIDPPMEVEPSLAVDDVAPAPLTDGVVGEATPAPPPAEPPPAADPAPMAPGVETVAPAPSAPPPATVMVMRTSGVESFGGFVAVPAGSCTGV